MRKRYLILLMIAGVVLITAASVTIKMPGTHKTGPVLETLPPALLTEIINNFNQVTPETIPESILCGSWSNQTTGSVGVAISQKYGEFRNCMFFDNSWIITTLGLKGQSGIIAVYRCDLVDSTCLNGQADHPLKDWHFYEPPCPGGLTVGRADDTTGRILLLGNGCPLVFDVANDTFTIGFK